MNDNLVLECLRELLLDPTGINMPMRKLLVELIDKEFNPEQEPTLRERTKDVFSESDEGVKE